MRRMIRLSFLCMMSVALLLPSVALAAGGGGASPLVIVVDTRNLSGIMLWWGNLYNESHTYFTLVTIITIPLVGLAFGLLADLVMHWIGLDLKNRELAEH